jgi:fluoroacetyl-CoA thioesterase
MVYIIIQKRKEVFILEAIQINIGTSMIIQKKIEEEDTALNYGSGQLETLLATPSLVALMIEAAVKAVDDKLPEGFITVGKMTKVVHEKPTELGDTVSVKVEVKDYDGVRILFEMIAYDEIGIIGRGTHERIIVNKKSLLNRARERSKELEDMNY